MGIIIRAIDVGYGNTKHSMTDSGQIGGIQCRHFPSLVPAPAPSMPGQGPMSGRRNTVVVKVEDSYYEVGPEVEQAMSNDRDGRALHRDYAKTNEYMALSLGALAYMGADRIDLLVVGLPVNASADRYAALEKRLTGTHELTNGRKCTVHKVMAVAQPMGGLVDYAHATGQLRAIRKQTSLLIDVGFFTTDWVVAKGSEPVSARSGAINLGVSAVLRTIGTALEKDLNEQFNLNVLDTAVRTGEFKYYGKPVSIGQYIPCADSIIAEALNAVQAKVGPSYDIDNVIVVGGGALLFSNALAGRFDKHQVKIGDGSMFANVRGFQLLGEMEWSRLQRTMGVAV